MKILLGDLKDRAEELSSFLEPRIGTKPSASGSEIEIEDKGVREGVRPRHVKTYIKRFLHKAGQRRSYRVLVSGTELSVVHLEREEEEEAAKVEEKKQEPAAPESPKEEAPKQDVKEKEQPEPSKKPKKAPKKTPA